MARAATASAKRRSTLLSDVTSARPSSSPATNARPGPAAPATMTATADVQSAAQRPSARYSIERKKKTGMGASRIGVHNPTRVSQTFAPITAAAASVMRLKGSMTSRMRKMMRGVSPKVATSGAVSMWNSGAWLSKMSRYSRSPCDQAQATCRCCHSSESNPQWNPQITRRRTICGFHWGFDSDEWQHLHVAWAWSQGLLEYRDIFDNHAPLFHMLTAPLVATFGETPRIIFLMRLVMLPFSLMTLAAAAVIGAKVWDTRVGLWTPILLAPIPVFFFRSIEYRADGLWAALCTSAVAVMVAGAAGPGRAFVAGLLLGLALVTSLKSVLLLFALAVAALAMPLAAGGMRRGAPQRVRLRLLPPLLGGLALTPVAFVGYFAHRGAVQA